MRDYNIDEVRQILKNHNGDELKLVPHFHQRWLERDFKINYVIDCLLNNIPLSITKTNINRFKLIFPHETKPTMDLYVIIEIDDYGIVTVLTAYTNNKRRREHEYKFF